ncbi:hypothetical protein, partial [Isoptericola halotolerans]|uniref:hypothetical protein n=1 Tax=Isoptericola halotolerans TaxID=300560 RepID=UPI0031E12A4B
MDPLTVLALAQLDEEYRAVVGRLPERPGRDPELGEAVRRQIETDGRIRVGVSTSGLSKPLKIRLQITRAAMSEIGPVSRPDLRRWVVGRGGFESRPGHGIPAGHSLTNR